MYEIKKYNYWDKNIIEKLINVIKNSTLANKKINWDKVAKHFPDRTRQQCKSYFTNQLKKNVDLGVKMYHGWTDEESQLLIAASQEMNKNWLLIQQKYFPHLRVKQVQTKYFNTIRANEEKAFQPVNSKENESVSIQTNDEESVFNFVKQLLNSNSIY